MIPFKKLSITSYFVVFFKCQSFETLPFNFSFMEKDAVALECEVEVFG